MALNLLEQVSKSVKYVQRTWKISKILKQIMVIKYKLFESGNHKKEPDRNSRTKEYNNWNEKYTRRNQQ